MKTYITQSGDTWDMIAYKQFGDAKLVHHLIEANFALANISIFSAGTVLVIPTLSVTQTAMLPPWKR